MLVLTRKKNESIVINDVIKVTVVEIRGDKVRLGIEAPREIDVHRQEVYEQIHGKHHHDEPHHEATAAPVPPTEGSSAS
jgi:carbon storage regulator